MNDNPQSIVLAYPHNGMGHVPFFKSLMLFREYDMQHRKVLRGIDDEWGLYPAGNRNVLCTRFLDTDWQWILFLDSDHAFSPAAVYQLLDDADSIDRPIVSALYFGINQGSPVPMWWNKDEYGQHSTITNITPGVQRIDAAGMGCCIIHRRVLETMRAKSDPNDSWTWFGHDLGWDAGRSKRMGEDFTFFERAAKLGFEAYGDAKVVITHMKTVALDLEMFLKLNEPRKPDAPVQYKILSAAV